MIKFPEKEYLETVCRIGQGADCCRYLTMDARGWGCEKYSSLKPLIDYKVSSGQFTARGDNCDGVIRPDTITKQ